MARAALTRSTSGGFILLHNGTSALYGNNLASHFNYVSFILDEIELINVH